MADEKDSYKKLVRKLYRKRRNLAIEEAENKRRGVPNWWKSDKYNFWQELNRGQRKWEFLRRSDVYWSDWQRYKNAKVGKAQDTLGKYLAEAYGLNKIIDPTTQGKNFSGKCSAIAAEGCGIYPIIEESESFLQSIGCAPAKEPEDAWQKEMSELADAMGEAREDHYGLIVNVKFNLAYPAIDQARFIGERLAKMQKVRKALSRSLEQSHNKYLEDDYIPFDIRERNRRGNKKTRDKGIEQDNHVLLLRVLDAANCGLTHEAIAEGLTEDGTLTDKSWDASTISRKIPYAQNLWRQM